MSISIDDAIGTMKRQIQWYATPLDFFLYDALKELKDLRAELVATESQVPAKQPARITKQDLQQIANSVGNSMCGSFWEWYESEGRTLLKKLNTDRTTQAYWDYYQNLLKQNGFEGITDLLSKYHKLAEQVSVIDEVVAESELVEALCDLRGCIMETRGPNAHSALERADAAIVAYRKRGEWVNDDDA